MGSAKILTIRKRHFLIIGPNKWAWGESVLYAFTYFLVYKVIMGVYYYMLMKGFDFSASEIFLSQVFL